MTKTSTKRALLLSVLALIVCASMLIGTTFAWFTDSVTSANNKIQAGTLKVDLELLQEDGTWKSIKDSAAPIFNNDKWEPGYTEARVLRVTNEGSLALNWYAKFMVKSELTDLANVIDVYVKEDVTAIPATRDLTGYTKVGTVADFVDKIEATTKGVLYPQGNADGKPYQETLGIILQMQESAGNEYQGLSLTADTNGNATGFDIQILATQLTYEKDSFNDQYDKDAEPSYSNSAILSSPTASYVEIEVRDNHTKQYKVASLLFPADSIEDATKPIDVLIEKSTYTDANIVIGAGLETLVYNISATNIKDGNAEDIKVMIKLDTGLDPATVEVYHYDQLIASSYDPGDGYVTFFTDNFSPFTIVYDAESTYDAPDTDGKALPEAKVERKTDYENVDIEWKTGGPVSITPGLDTQLNAAYTFSCTETLEQVEESPYAQWACDFYVMLDRDLGANEIFLGGEYGNLKVGFHNGDVTLLANEELPLLGSVTTNPWTYLDVVQNVGTFICGVGDVGDKLAEKGATFTVMLRLTNPDDATEYYNISTVTYNFATGAHTISYYGE